MPPSYQTVNYLQHGHIERYGVVKV